MVLAEQQVDEERKIVYLAIDLIDPSPYNRKHFDEKKFENLVQSVKSKGVQQPILVRPKPRGRFELVFGERRWRASGRAGRKTVPAVVEPMTDQEAIERQAIENDQREDVHPLDQAETYHRLHQPPAGADYAPKSIDEIASTLGRSAAYVRQRLRLVTLCEKARRAFFAGEVDVSVAQLVARVPNVAMQERALAEVSRDGGMRFEEAKAHIRDHYLLAITGAPFDTADEKLVPAAGSCAACPKRTGNQRELFADITKNDVCTDIACYREKVDAHWKRIAADAEKKGGEVVPAKETKKLFPYGDGRLAHDADYVDLDAKCFSDPKERTYRKLIGKRAPVALARDPSGAIRELARKDKVRAALKDAGHEIRRVDTVAGADQALKRERARAALVREATRDTIAGIVESITQEPEQPLYLGDVLFDNVLRIAWAGAVAATAARRKVAKTPQALRKLWTESTEVERMALALEVLLHSGCGSGLDGKIAKHVLDAAHSFGATVPKIAQPKAPKKKGRRA